MMVTVSQGLPARDVCGLFLLAVALTSPCTVRVGVGEQAVEANTGLPPLVLALKTKQVWYVVTLISYQGKIQTRLHRASELIVL